MEFIHYFQLASKLSAICSKAGLTMHGDYLGRLMPSLNHHHPLSPGFIAKHEVIWYRTSAFSV